MRILDGPVGEKRRGEIAIVGAGVVGLAIALQLAERGVGSVAVYERTGVGAEASGVQPGGVRQQWGTELNCLMARESVAFYRDVAARLDAPTQPRLDLCGYLFLAASEARLEQLRADVALQNRLGIPSRLLAPGELDDVLPGIDATGMVGGSYCSEDGYVDKPQAVVEAFAAAAQRAGAEIVVDEVLALEQRGSDWLLRHRSGRTSSAGTVVVAAGYDTPALLASLGVAVPIAKEPRYLFFSDPIGERLLEPLVVASELRFASKQLASGRVLASDLAAGSDGEHAPDEWRGHVKDVSRSLLPVLEFVSYPLLVEGFYDVTPDHQAILGPVDGHDGLWLAAGFSGHGFMMAPAAGARLAAAIVGDGPDPLLDLLTLRRFEAEGLVPELQIV